MLHFKLKLFMCLQCTIIYKIWQYYCCFFKRTFIGTKYKNLNLKAK